MIKISKMKKIKLKGQLSLNKETISNLNEIRGGWTDPTKTVDSDCCRTDGCGGKTINTGITTCKLTSNG